jgi:hypothetical protein
MELEKLIEQCDQVSKECDSLILEMKMRIVAINIIQNL